MKTYKYFAMAALAVTSMMFSACHHDDNETWHIWKITIQGQETVYNKLVMPVGTTLQLELKLVPTFVNVVDPVWYIEDESVATISPEGLVSALRVGETEIYVYSEYNDYIYDHITLRVSGSTIDIEHDEPVDQAEAEARRK